MKKFKLGVCAAVLMSLIGVFTASVSLAQDAGPVPRTASIVQQR